MNTWLPPTEFIYSESHVPKFSAQPHVVYSSPGLGHFVQDFALYVPLHHTHIPDVKEVEKKLPKSFAGGYVLNPPLTGSVRGKKNRKHQKGQGNKKSTETEAIKTALDHPIKVT